LKEKITENEKLNEDNVETAWKKIKDNIINAATEAIGKRKVNINNRKRFMKPWFNEEVKKLVTEKRQTYVEYKNKVKTHEEYKAIRNVVNDKIKQIKQNYWEKFSKDMEKDLYGGQKKVWKMLRNRKKPINEYLQIPSISPEGWVTYFQKLYDNEEEVNNEFITTIEEEIIPIPIKDIQDTITQLKNRKAPGVDNISNEMIKYGGSLLVEEIHKLFRKIYSNMEIPAQWKESITIPIFKKGMKGTRELQRHLFIEFNSEITDKDNIQRNN
ncbi:hypothetical protein ANN_18990, partial [Periplaneta americana]